MTGERDQRPLDLEALTRRPGPGPHRATAQVRGVATTVLADLPPIPDRLLFVGGRPSAESIEAGHYHQDPAGRVFWDRLRIAGVIAGDARDDTADDALLAAGHGITDLVATPGAAADELGRAVGPVWQKIALWRPAAVVFLDRDVASAAAGRPVTERYGQLDGVALGGRPCFLMPALDATAEELETGLRVLRNLVASLPRASGRS